MFVSLCVIHLYCKNIIPPIYAFSNKKEWQKKPSKLLYSSSALRTLQLIHCYAPLRCAASFTCCVFRFTPLFCFNILSSCILFSFFSFYLFLCSFFRIIRTVCTSVLCTPSTKSIFFKSMLSLYPFHALLRNFDHLPKLLSVCVCVFVFFSPSEETSRLTILIS